MDLISWLEDLAAAYRIEPSEATTRRYLKSVERWRLDPRQWEELTDRAVLRLMRFPSIAELHEVACELRHEAQVRSDTEYLSGIRPDRDPAPTGAADEAR